MVPDQQGQTQVDLHFNINKPLPGVAAGDYNIMIRYHFKNYNCYLVQKLGLKHFQFCSEWPVDIRRCKYRSEKW